MATETAGTIAVQLREERFVGCGGIASGMARKIVNNNEVSFLRLGRKEVEVAIGSERFSAQPLLSWTVTAHSGWRVIERN